MDSGWLINFKNGYKMILSEVEYKKYKLKRNVEQIESEEYLFNIKKCIEKNPDIEKVI